jgi:Domain of unknown function (DUF4397)
MGGATGRNDPAWQGLAGEHSKEEAMLRRIRSVAILATLLLGLLAATPRPGAAADAMIRVVHASPDAPAVDVYLNGQRAVANLRFTEGTAYAAVPAGSYRVQVFPAGTGPGGTAVIDATLDLQGGTASTVAAVNVVARIEPLVLTDDLTAPAAGKAHIRVVHAAPDAPAVDVAVKGGPVAFRSVAFKSATPYAPLDAGTYQLEVRPAGTTQAVLTTDPVTLAAGRIYTVFAMGQVAGNSLQAVAFADNSTPGMPSTGGGALADAGPHGADLLLLGLLALRPRFAPRGR